MATFLFDDIVFGPVKSRRLDSSLGINLLPENVKVCNFDCVYCECGWTDPKGEKLPKLEAIISRMENGFQNCVENDIPVDAITFAGNGEPTLHPKFSEIVDHSILLRDKYLPKARIVVLTNAGILHKPAVRDALVNVDMALLKLDSGIEETVKIINQPAPGFNFQQYIENIKQFPGRKIIQTMFLTYEYDGGLIDNTTEEEIAAWLKALNNISPELVMIYSVARDTPDAGAKAISQEKLMQIAERVKQEGFQVEIS